MIVVEEAYAVLFIYQIDAQEVYGECQRRYTKDAFYGEVQPMVSHIHKGHKDHTNQYRMQSLHEAKKAGEMHGLEDENVQTTYDEIDDNIEPDAALYR